MGKSMGEAFNNMQKAMDAMTERDQNGSVGNTRNAMASSNKVAQQTQAAMNSLCRSPAMVLVRTPEFKPGREEGEGEGMSMGTVVAVPMQQILNQINAGRLQTAGY